MLRPKQPLQTNFSSMELIDFCFDLACTPSTFDKKE